MKKGVVCIFLACILALSACGEDVPDREGQEVMMPPRTNAVHYEMEEMPLPGALESGQEELQYIRDSFRGFVGDLQNQPAVYASSFMFEGEEYLADIARWTWKENSGWKEEHLCQNSFSEFLNEKYEQVEWKRFTLDQFCRGDDGSLYGIFTYYIKENTDVDGVPKEMDTQVFSVLQIDEENDQIFEIPLPDFTYSTEAEYRLLDDAPPGRDFTAYHVFEDGRILFIYTENGGECGKMIDGETGETLEDLGNIINGRRRFAFGESELLYFSKDDALFHVLSVPELEEDNTFGSQLGEDVIGKDWHFYTNPDTWELFLCNATGVYSAVSYLDSDEMECLTDKTDPQALEPLSGGDAELLDFFVDSEGEIYVCLIERADGTGNETNSYRMIHYKKEE